MTPTPELTAARADRDDLLVDRLIALVGSDAAAEELLAECRRLLVRCGDFYPDLPTPERNRKARHRALAMLITLRESGVV